MLIVPDPLISDVKQLILCENEDPRGSFTRLFDKHLFTEHGIPADIVSINESVTLHRGTIRGLHMQLPPMSETKIVRCTTGSILDIAVDLRSGSETYGRHAVIVLKDPNTLFLIPRGFAHGFQTIAKYCIVQYFVDNYYSKEHEVKINPFDVTLDINWMYGKNKALMSQEDQNAISLKLFESRKTS